MSNSKRPTRPAVEGKSGTRRTNQLVIAAIAVLCVASVIFIPVLLKGGGSNDSSGASTGDTSSPTVASKPSPTSVDDVVCDETPTNPTTAQQFSTAPDPSLAEGTTWTAVLHTTCGDIRLELDGAKAPQTVASFISLARADYWNDGPCHRLTTARTGIFVLQCGDPTGTGLGSPGYGFGIENAPPDGNYPRGTLAMARGTDPNSNGGQFFLVYKDTQLPTEGGGYTIFGKVTEGMEIIDAIAKQGAEDGRADAPPFQPISILSVDVTKN